MNLFQRTWLWGGHRLILPQTVTPQVAFESHGLPTSRMPEPYDRVARQELVWMNEDAQALRDEGLDPDDPAVIAAIDLVRLELSLGT